MADPISIRLLVGAVSNTSHCEGTFTPDPWIFQMFGTDVHGDYDAYTLPAGDGLNLQAYPYDIQVDGLGNIYVAGNQQPQGTPDEAWQGVVWKISSDGNLVWYKVLTANSHYWNQARGVAIADDGSVFVVGASQEQIQTGPGLFTYIDRPFMVKYDCSGNLLWQKYFKHSADDQQGTRFGGCRVSGNYLYTYCDPYFDGLSEVCFQKWDLDGNAIWTKTYTTGDLPDLNTAPPGGAMWANRMELDSAGNMIVALAFNDSPNNNNSESIGTAKIDTDGNLSWVHVLDLDYVYTDMDDVTVAPDGSVYRVSSEDYKHCYLIKLSSDGVLQWQKDINMGGLTDTGGTWGFQCYYPRITCDETGNPILILYSDRYNTSAGQVVKFDPNGNIIWQNVIETGAGSDWQYFSDGAATYRNGMFYYTTGDVADDWNRFNYMMVAKLPVTPLTEGVSFSNQVGYYPAVELNYTVKAVDTTYVSEDAPITARGITTNTNSIVPYTLTLTEVSGLDIAAPTLLTPDALATQTGQHWITTYYEQNIGNYGAETAFYNCINDSAGNVIAAGFTYPVQGNSWGGNPPYLAKYSSSGNLLWSKYVNRQNFNNYKSHLAVDSSDNIYHIFDEAGNEYICIYKHDQNGNLVWQKQITGANLFTVRGARFLNGNIMIYGNHYYGTNSSLQQQAVLMEVSTSGVLTNQIEWGGPDTPDGRVATDECFGLVQAGDGNFVVACETNPDTVAASEQLLLKLNGWTNWTWQRRLGTDQITSVSAGNEKPYNLHQDASGNLYTFGVTTAGSGQSQYTFRHMLSKYDSAGNFQWMRQWHSPGWAQLGDWEGRRSVMVGNYIYAIWNYQAASPLQTQYNGQAACVSQFDLAGNHINTYAIIANGEEILWLNGISSDGTNAYLAIKEEGDVGTASVLAKLPLAGMPQDCTRGRYFFRTITMSESIIAPHELAGSILPPTTTTWTMADLSDTFADTPAFLTNFKQLLD